MSVSSSHLLKWIPYLCHVESALDSRDKLVSRHWDRYIVATLVPKERYKTLSSPTLPFSRSPLSPCLASRLTYLLSNVSTIEKTFLSSNGSREDGGRQLMSGVWRSSKTKLERNMSDLRPSPLNVSHLPSLRLIRHKAH
jgi:hypothetical protein